jgi:hypothetical protein
MSPKVWDQQHLKTNGKFTIKGPTGTWDSDEVAAVFIVVITQPKAGSVAVGRGKSIVYTRPPDGKSFIWEADVTHIAGPPFQEGPADVHAWAAVAEGGGLADPPYECDVPVEIIP